MHSTLSSLLYLLGIPFGMLLLLLVAYGLITLVGGLVPVHPHFRPTEKGVDIYVSTNGMHTNFILPATNEIFDWTGLFDPQWFEINVHARAFLSFGWGDRAIYLDLPAWDQLTLGMGIRTLLIPTPALMHIEAHRQPPTERTFRTSLSEAQYARLCQFIFRKFALDRNDKVQLIPNAGYTENDQFFQAEGRYHAFHTCNTWVNEGLKESGVRTALWASIDRILFYQLKKIPVATGTMVFETTRSC